VVVACGAKNSGAGFEHLSTVRALCSAAVVILETSSADEQPKMTSAQSMPLRGGNTTSGAGRRFGERSRSGPAHLVENQLQQYLRLSKKDEVQAMNCLQEHGIVSDNCVDASEVANTGEAVRWLYDNWHKLCRGC